MKDQIEQLRAEMWAYLRSGQRANRRKILAAYKHVNSAALILGCERIRPERPAGNAEPITYPDAGKAIQEPAEEANTILATNYDQQDKPGPEKPKRGRKAKGE